MSGTQNQFSHRMKCYKCSIGSWTKAWYSTPKWCSRPHKGERFTLKRTATIHQNQSPHASLFAGGIEPPVLLRLPPGKAGRCSLTGPSSAHYTCWGFRTSISPTQLARETPFCQGPSLTYFPRAAHGQAQQYCNWRNIVCQMLQVSYMRKCVATLKWVSICIVIQTT